VTADARDPDAPEGCTRRDFIIGAGGAVGASLLAPLAGADAAAGAVGTAGAVDAAVPYPPALQGLRGNHEGSYTYPHQLRDGQFALAGAGARETGEHYDLVVVGAGISGLSAAHYYRRRFGARAKILLLDNHDDFGGHAKRNEFTVDGRTVLAYGGVQNIDNPSTYSAVAMGLLRELGIRVEALPRNFNAKLYEGLGTACFFDAETFGSDRFLPGMGVRAWPEFLAAAPLTERQRADITRLYGERVDYLPQLDLAAKTRLLAKTSYADYLTGHCGVDKATLAFFQSYTHDLFGVGIDAVSALTCYHNPDDYESFTYPGFDGLGLEPIEKEPYTYHFPDGNATIARLLVRGLIPEAIPSAGVAGIVTAHAHYDRLDRQGSRVRLRLSSPVAQVRTGAHGVQVDYVAAGRALERVTARHCVLACNHGMIPYLCPELPDGQKEALHYGVKAPFLYTRVALRNWQAFANLGVRQIVAPGAYHSYTALDMPVSMGDYRFAQDPSGPMVLFMLRAPCAPGLPMREQYRVGRAELLQTAYADIEAKVRDQLQRMLGGGGFDATRDIAGITANRWAHGYAYEYESLWDPAWPPGHAPNQVARRRHGPIAIANADAAARAYTDAAIDEAHRAVGELPG
jgi:spermidine dehydrogenase